MDADQDLQASRPTGGANRQLAEGAVLTKNRLVGSKTPTSQGLIGYWDNDAKRAWSTD